MTAADICRAEEIEKQCFSCPWSKKSFEASVNLPVSVWLCAYSGEKMIGFAGAYCIDGEAEILDIAVDPEYRRRGIGRTLLNGILEVIMSKGADSVFLDVRRSNVPAISLYSSLGFTVYTLRTGYYSKPVEDAFGMRMDILNK